MSGLPPTTSARAGVALLPFLEGCRLAELEDFYLFWVGSEPLPSTHAELVQRLDRRMRTPETVRAKLKLFTRAQREVLMAVVAAEGCTVDRVAILEGTLTDGVPAGEIDVAARTLRKRGFLAEVAGAAGRGAVCCVPRELGQILARLVRGSDRPARGLFSLAGFLEGRTTDQLVAAAGSAAAGGAEERETALRTLADPAHIRERVAAVADARVRALIERVALQFGGLLTRSLFARIEGEGLAWSVETLRPLLEGHLLGTAGHLDFEPFGIALTEEVVVLFGEVVQALLEARRPDPARLVRRVNFGADALSDVQRILSFLGRERVRVTRNGALYKTMRKRLQAEMIFRETGRLTRDRVLDLLLEFLRARDFVRVRSHHTIVPTREGLVFGQLGLKTQMKQLVRHVLGLSSPHAGEFHGLALLGLLLEHFRAADPDVWLDPMELPFRARNAYLAELEARAVKEAFRTQYEYALHPPRQDPFQMAWRLHELLTEGFLLLGLVEAASVGERRAAIRVTPLGRELLGPEVERRRARPSRAARAGATAPPCLIVNPDFEVLLHPGPDTLEVVHFLDRIAERLHADHHLHFRIVRERVQDLVGRGVGVDPVIATLQASAHAPLPPNVVTTLRDWAGGVDTVAAREVLLLECERPEVLDRIEAMRECRAAVHRRLGPDALALDGRKVPPDLAERLRRMGVFLR